MGEVIQLAQVRARRQERCRALAGHAVMHPVLQWTAGGSPAAHRRTRAGTTACGLPGPLTLADRGTERCPHCYRPAAAT